MEQRTELIQIFLSTVFEQMAQQGNGLRTKFEDYLECGCLEHGF